MKTKSIFTWAFFAIMGAGYAQTTSVGTGAGTAGADNTNVGDSAGASITIDGRDTFVGYHAGRLTTTGLRNTGVGYLAGEQNTVGTDNVYVGASSGANNTTSQNVFVGSRAGTNSTGAQNIYVGHQAGFNNQGAFNVFVGQNTGMAASTAGDNVFCGHSAGSGNLGMQNVFVGRSAAEFNTNGGHNTMLGFWAGRNSNGSNNVFLGYYAGQSSAGGSNNVFLGDHAGQSSVGSNNVFLGNYAGQNEANSNRLYIANTATTTPLIYGEFANGSNPAILKFNAKRVGIGYETLSSGVGFGSFPNIGSAYTPDLTDYKLFVKGGILATQVRVRLTTSWPDYVFDNDYKLMSLPETEQYIAQNGHLPNMPSAAQVDAEGIEVGNMAKLQQEKIEELTLHVIELNKQVEALKAQNAELLELKAKVDQLLNQK